MRKILNLLVGTLLAAASTANGAGTTTPALDRLLDAWQREDLVQGSVAHGIGDAPLLQRSIGLARVQPQAQPADASTAYRIGSVSKLMTAVIVMQLVDEGRLSLETPLAHFFPQITNGERITVEHLLRHRSGLADLTRTPDFDQRWAFDAQSESALVAAIARLGAQRPPGERAEYNNTGFMLLTYIAQRAGGAGYHELLARRIAAPLGLQHTYYADRLDARPGEARALQADWPRPPERAGTPAWRPMREAHPSVPLGAGAVVSSARDLVVFTRALFDGGERRLVSAASLARMTTLVDGYGLGLRGIQVGGEPAFGHDGDIDSFTALLRWFPKQRLALAWVSNGQRIDRLLPREWIAAAALGQPVPSFAPVERILSLELDLASEAGNVKDARSVGIRGNAAPLSWFATTPMQRDAATGRYRIELALKGLDGLPFEYKFVHGPAHQPVWERIDNRRLDLARAPQGVITHRLNVDAALDTLRREVLALDARFFDAFNRRDAATLGAMLADDLEFFHDRNGLTGRDFSLRALASAPREGGPQRSLVEDSVEVWPLPGFGAAQSGKHRFCTRPPGASAESCSVYRFTHLWRERGGQWQLARIISLDH
jgi:CubicO group peptidase (beta-lactamase class C family)/ketosteroid isomerase-like protein